MGYLVVFVGHLPYEISVLRISHPDLYSSVSPLPLVTTCRVVHTYIIPRHTHVLSESLHQRSSCFGINRGTKSSTHTITLPTHTDGGCGGHPRVTPRKRRNRSLPRDGKESQTQGLSTEYTLRRRESERERTQLRSFDPVFCKEHF